MKKLILSLFLMFGLCLELPQSLVAHPQADANGYHYKDESTVQDKRQIAILAYGSLIKQPVNQQSGVKLETSSFVPTSLTLPVSLTRQSQGTRITAVIDQQEGEPKRVWVSTSSFHFLPNARQNVAGREGTPYQGQPNGYKLDNIFYLKKRLHGQAIDSNEEAVANTGWVIRKAPPRQKLPEDMAKALVQWGETHGYSAFIWASFPPNLESKQEVLKRLLLDNALLQNTQAYVQNLPDGAQTSFEKAVLAGKQTLLAISQAQQSGLTLTAALAAAGFQNQAALSEDLEKRYQQFTYYQRGNLPIILTAPHGGIKSMPDVPNRTGITTSGSPIPQFETCLDDGTLELAQLVSDEIFQISGKRPYLVAADFTRKQIDANRPRGIRAFEDPQAGGVYDFYHGQIREFVDEIKGRFRGEAILIDIHGQGVSAKTVYRGTRDRLTVARMMARHGEAALTGDSSILGSIENKGRLIYPASNNPHTNEKSAFQGGHTVAHYGSHQVNGIDAIQLEMGWELRRNERAAFARDLAESIVRYYNTWQWPYLPNE